MISFLQAGLSGLSYGAMIGLIAVGVSLSYRSTKVVNFAQGDLAALGAYLAYQLNVVVGLPYLVALVLAACTVGIGLAFFERLVLVRTYRRGIFYAIIATIGLSVVIQSSIRLIWGSESKNIPSAFGSQPLHAGSLVLIPEKLWIFAIGMVLAALLFVFLTKTRTGTAMRSAAQNREVSEILGIPVRRSFGLAFLMAGALAAAGGVLVAPITYLTPDMGSALAVGGFVAAIAGGMGNVQGAVLGGLLLGLVQAWVALYIDPNYLGVVTYLLLAAILVFRPRGIFGEEGVGVRDV